MRDIPVIDVAPLIYEAAHATVLKEACKELGLQEDVQLLSLHGIQWHLAFEQSSEHPNFVDNMLKLEALLQQKTRKKVDIRLRAKKDKNNRQERNVLWKNGEQK